MYLFKKTFRKAGLILLSLSLILSSSVLGQRASASELLGSTAAVAQEKPPNTELTDIQGHWAQKQVSEWWREGLVKGYSDGSFRPDEPVSRAETMALVNRSFGYVESAPISFADLKISDWAYEDAAKAVKAGYLSGYEDGTIGAGKPVSRQEMAVILTRLLKQEETDNRAADRFRDAMEIAPWSKKAVNAAVSAGMMLGNGNRFMPMASLTRAELVVILDRALKSLTSSEYDKAGIYGSEQSIREIPGDVIVSVPGVTLQNMKIGGDLLLAEGIGEGDVRLRNVVVQGETSIQGGGENSVYLENSILGKVIVNKKTGKIRIVMKGTTTIAELVILTLVNLEVGSNGEIVLLRLEASANVTGQGRIQKAVVGEKGRGSTFELKPDIQEGAEFANAGSSASTGGSGSNGGNGGGSQIQLAALSAVNGTLTATLNQIPSAIPVIGDFAIVSIVNNGAAVPVTPTLVSWNEANKQATLTVPVIPAASVEQSVVYRVSYKGTSTVQSAPFVIHSGVAVAINGQAQGYVVVPAEADPKVSGAADALIQYVMKSTGAALTKLTDEELEMNGSPAGLDTAIYVGLSREEDTAYLDGKLEDLDDDGYVIDARNDTLTIVGPTDSGTQYGVYEFLERYVGVRWLLPGPNGEDVPASSDLYVPTGTIQEEPAYKSRGLYGVHTDSFFFSPDNEDNYQWGVVNRTNNRIIGYNHYLWYLFVSLPGYPGENYATTHPEFYPLRNGERFIPTSDVLWQPCFTEEGTVTAAVSSIVAYFNANPEATSFSLAVNDGGGFCEAEPDHPANPHRLNSIGLPDMSDIYYDWVNKVVEGVLQVHPDKWFGVLAYQEVNDPPSFKLNDRVIPYFTKDRMTWIDDGIRAKDQGTTEQWTAVSANLAFYDYVYGTPYMVPRVYPHQMAEYLRFGKENGVIAYFAELLPNWGEGPKPWLLTKLLWDPERNVDAMLNDWYVRAVGAEAAPDLKAYFDHWESFWTDRIKDTEWFEERKGITYLSYYWGTYLEAVTAQEMEDSRSLLESVLAKAVTPQQKARAEMLFKQFEYYEASALSYPKKETAPETEQAALQMLELGASSQVKADYAAKRLALVDAYKNDPLLHHQVDPYWDKLIWSGWSPSLVWGVTDYVKRHEPTGGAVRERIAMMASGEDAAEKEYAELLLNVLAGTTVNANPSFETGTTQAQAWDTWVMNYGEFKRLEEPAHALTGDASIYIHNFYYGDLSQTVPVKPGLITAKLSYFVTKQTQTVGDTWLQLDFLDEQGAVLDTIKSNQQAYSSGRGKWNLISVMGKVPETVNGKAVKQVKVSVTVNGFFEGGELYMDDFEVYQSVESDPPAPLLISQVQASNGEIEVTFYDDPGQTPSNEEFMVTSFINGKSEAVTPTVLSWIAGEKKAILSVPAVPDRVWEQSVVYGVAFRDSAVVRSVPFEVSGNVGDLEQFVQNSSFEEGEENADNWTFWGEGFSRSNAVRRTGSYSLAADGLQPGQNEAGGGGPFQTAGLEPGTYVGVFRYNTSANTKGVLSWNVQPMNGSGAIVRSLSSDKRPAAASRGNWVPFEFEFEIAPGESSARFFVLLNEFKKGDTIYFDDVEIYRIPNAEAEVSVVNATYGHLDVVLTSVPVVEPVAADFVLSSGVNASDEAPVAPTSMSWNSDMKTVSFTVPELQEKPWDQSVVYSVSYKGQDAVNALPVEIPGNVNGLTQIAQNGGFEDWNTESDASAWTFWGEGFTRSNAVVRSGAYSLVADGLQPGQNAAGGGGPLQTVSVQEGSYFGLFRFVTNVPTNGKLSVVVHQIDGTGNVTSNVSSAQRSAKRSAGAWTPFEFSFEAAPGTVSVRYYIVLNDFNKGDTI
ncbi:DUF4838 domain-containing protein, partial [Cohnella sp.]|uniref:DUF4838 domain-containing protein n=1 Tax=Cohnella sp. TaxID=1883426 RepID=UPI003703B822